MGFDGVLGMEFPESPHLQHCHSWAGNNSDTALGCVQNTVVHIYDAQPASTRHFSMDRVEQRPSSKLIFF